MRNLGSLDSRLRGNDKNSVIYLLLYNYSIMIFKILKRIIDIIGSLIGLIILLPFFPFIALAIKLDYFFSVIPDPSSVIPAKLVLELHRGAGIQKKNWIPHQVRNDKKETGMTNKFRVICAIAQITRNFLTNNPVFVKLDRVSEGKIIKVYKFRSMVLGAEKQKKKLLNLNERNDGPFFKIKNDPRVTKVGRFLRKTRIDELPQLINVLRGELSLVGPRPHEPEELFAYPREYRELLTAKTGITGLSQVNGASGLPFLKELEYDKFYLLNQSLWLDIKILLKTIVIFFTDPTGV